MYFLNIFPSTQYVRPMNMEPPVWLDLDVLLVGMCRLHDQMCGLSFVLTIVFTASHLKIRLLAQIASSWHNPMLAMCDLVQHQSILPSKYSQILN